MFKRITKLFESEGDKHIRQRIFLISLLDGSIYNERRCDIWQMYAIFDEHNLKGDIGDILKGDPNKLLLFITDKLLEGWEVDYD